LARAVVAAVEHPSAMMVVLVVARVSWYKEYHFSSPPAALWLWSWALAGQRVLVGIQGRSRRASKAPRRALATSLPTPDSVA
jgi:hypothetical protein